MNQSSALKKIGRERLALRASCARSPTRTQRPVWRARRTSNLISPSAGTRPLGAGPGSAGARPFSRTLSQELSDVGDGLLHFVAVPAIRNAVSLTVQAPKQVLGGLARGLPQSQRGRKSPVGTPCVARAARRAWASPDGPVTVRIGLLRRYRPAPQRPVLRDRCQHPKPDVPDQFSELAEFRIAIRKSVHWLIQSYLVGRWSSKYAACMGRVNPHDPTNPPPNGFVPIKRLTPLKPLVEFIPPSSSRPLPGGTDCHHHEVRRRSAP